MNWRQGFFQTNTLCFTLDAGTEWRLLAYPKNGKTSRFHGPGRCAARARLSVGQKPRHKALLEMLSNAALSSDLAQFSSQELANTLWSSASLKFGSEAMVDAMARHVMAEVIPEAISQNIVNIAWALDCLGWTDQGEAFCRILQQFLKVCSGSLGVEWITLASLAEERRVVLPSFTAPFEALVLRPALRHLEALRHAEQACEAQVLQAMQDWVEDLQLPHMGPVFLTDALAAAGALASRGDAAWMGEARAAVKASAWWSCPKAAVSSQGVVAFLVAEIQIGQSCVRFNPGTVFLADDSLGPVLVERLLQPIFLQVPRHGHAERRAMVSLLRSALQTAASLGHHVKEATGWARLYASHYFCISCLAVLAQLGRQMPLVLFEVGCDDAWKSWEEREPNASYALQIGVPC